MRTIKKKLILFPGARDLKLPVLHDGLGPLLKRVCVSVKREKKKPLHTDEWAFA